MPTTDITGEITQAALDTADAHSLAQNGYCSCDLLEPDPVKYGVEGDDHHVHVARQIALKVEVLIRSHIALDLLEDSTEAPKGENASLAQHGAWIDGRDAVKAAGIAYPGFRRLL